MIVIMKPSATAAEIGAVIRKAESMGAHTHPIYGENRTVVALVGDLTGVTREVFDQMEGVLNTLRIQEPYKLSSRTTRPENSLVEVAGGRVRIGGNEIVVMAGPCSVESRSQIVEIAHAVREAGATVLRGGAFKPRTSPYDFQGMGLKGLEYLAEAREQTGLPVITEVMREEQVPMVAEYADLLQIGARNMQNYGLLQAVGKQQKPVMLKRGISGTIRGTAHVCRIHRQQRQLQRAALRARHPHLRNGDTQHLRSQRSAGAERTDPSAGGGRSIAWHRTARIGSGHEPRGRRCRRRCPDPGGSP